MNSDPIVSSVFLIESVLTNKLSVVFALFPILAKYQYFMVNLHLIIVKEALTGSDSQVNNANNNQSNKVTWVCMKLISDN